jgi:hypothetical protein
MKQDGRRQIHLLVEMQELPDTQSVKLSRMPRTGNCDHPSGGAESAAVLDISGNITLRLRDVNLDKTQYTLVKPA